MYIRGDEVIFTCLDEFPRVKEWMKQQGMNTSSYVDLIQFYSQKLAAIVNRFANFSISIDIFHFYLIK